MSETIPPTYDQEQYTHILSSFLGLGHSGRAIAIAEAMDPAQPLTFVARERAHDFLRTNLSDYQAPINFAVPDYDLHKQTADDDYERRNQHLIPLFAKSKAVINDFHLQIPGLRSLIRQSGVSAPFVGIYHSIGGFDSTSPEVTQFRDNIHGLAADLDVLYLTEPRETQRDPYELAGGTQVIPCPPIVRKPTAEPATVKAELGLQPDDEFVYVQGGGLTSGHELEHVARSLKDVSINGLKIVVALKDVHDLPPAGDNVVYMAPRPDGHNVIAASSGVITKPGMGTIAETIALRKPLLLVDYPTAEAQTKYDMLRSIVGDLPFRLDPKADLSKQLSNWILRSKETSEIFESIPCDGAKFLATSLHDLHS